jgi:hypothetical protein
VAAASAAPQADTKYSGKTSQGKKVSLRTNPTGEGVESFVIRRVFRCGDETVEGTFRTFRSDGGVMPVKLNGRFYGHAKIDPGGAIKRGEFTIRGRFGPNGGAARGTYRERVRLKSGTRCDTREIRFRVAAPGY